MRIPGFLRRDRQAIADPAAGQVYVERRPGESTAAFEMRLAAAAREREIGLREGGREFARRTDPPVTAAPVTARREKVAKAPRPPRRRHRGFGLVGLAVTLVAVLGVLWVALAAREGSFAAGGALVDQKIAEATLPAKAAATQAVDRTGQAVQNAGQALESQGQKIRQKAN